MYVPGEGPVLASDRATACDGGGAVSVPEIFLSEAEREAIEVLASYVVEPGSRCPTCHRQVYRPRKQTSPEARKIDAGRLPEERAAWVEDNIDALQEYVGADGESYSRGSLLELLVALGAEHREELKDYFERREGS